MGDKWEQQAVPLDKWEQVAETVGDSYDQSKRGSKLKGDPKALPETFMGTLANDLSNVARPFLAPWTGDQPPAPTAGDILYNYLPGVQAYNLVKQIPGGIADIYNKGQWGKGAARALEVAAPFAGEMDAPLTGFTEGFQKHMSTAPPSTLGKHLGRMGGAYAGHTVLPGAEGILTGGYYGGEIGSQLFNVPSALKAGFKRSVQKMRQAGAPPRSAIWENNPSSPTLQPPELKIPQQTTSLTGRRPGPKPMGPPPPPKPVAPWLQEARDLREGLTDAPSQQPVPDLEIPKQTVSPTGRKPGTGEPRFPDPPETGPARTAIWEDNVPTLRDEPVMPQQPIPPPNRMPGHLKPTLFDQADQIREKFRAGGTPTPEELQILEREKEFLTKKATPPAAKENPMENPPEKPVAAEKPKAAEPVAEKAVEPPAASKNTGIIQGAQVETHSIQRPAGIPDRYWDIWKEHGRDAALRTLAKDTKIAQHLIDNKITPEAWDEMPFENQHKLAVEGHGVKRSGGLKKSGSQSREEWQSVADIRQRMVDLMREAKGMPEMPE